MEEKYEQVCDVAAGGDATHGQWVASNIKRNYIRGVKWKKLVQLATKKRWREMER